MNQNSQEESVILQIQEETSLDSTEKNSEYQCRKRFQVGMGVQFTISRVATSLHHKTNYVLKSISHYVSLNEN